MRLTLVFGLVAAVLLFAASSFGAAGKDHCDRLLPKGGGTVVNGVFVQLEPGQYLTLCTHR